MLWRVCAADLFALRKRGGFVGRPLALAVGHVARCNDHSQTRFTHAVGAVPYVLQLPGPAQAAS